MSVCPKCRTTYATVHVCGLVDAKNGDILDLVLDGVGTMPVLVTVPPEEPPQPRQHVTDAAWALWLGEYPNETEEDRIATEEEHCLTGTMLVTVEEWESRGIDANLIRMARQAAELKDAIERLERRLIEVRSAELAKPMPLTIADQVDPRFGTAR